MVAVKDGDDNNSNSITKCGGQAVCARPCAKYFMSIITFHPWSNFKKQVLLSPLLQWETVD